jgi:hypothetical protein
MERYRPTCKQCGRYLTEVQVERDLLGRDVNLSLYAFCVHVSVGQVERELDAILTRRSQLPVSVEALGRAT